MRNKPGFDKHACKVTAWCVTAVAVALAGVVQSRGACTHRSASRIASTDCSTAASNAVCRVVSYNNMPNGAQSQTGNPWTTYGDSCVSSPGSWTDCKNAGVAQLYIKTDSGLCQDGQCDIDSPGTWNWYGSKIYWVTAECDLSG